MSNATSNTNKKQIQADVDRNIAGGMDKNAALLTALKSRIKTLDWLSDTALQESTKESAKIQKRTLTEVIEAIESM